jgi:hypothetical protein
MNENNHPDGASATPWNGGDHRARTPDTTPMAAGDQAPTPAVDLLNQAVQGTHDALDHLAQRAAPVAQQLGDGVAAAEDDLREARDEWVDGLRDTVRRKPLASLALALALGAVIARITR